MDPKGHHAATSCANVEHVAQEGKETLAKEDVVIVHNGRFQRRKADMVR